MSSLSGKTVVIIAGSRGLGLETARQARGSSADRSLDGDHRVGRLVKQPDRD
jgi:NAD(P)-dependent dehydrogenase (short-subunit alcohol dehydrogenase family)